MNQKIPPRLRANRMYCNLEYILVEQLADVPFITAAYLEQHYNNIPNITTTLEEDLRELSLDLYEIIETNPNFRDIFLVIRSPSSSAGFLRKNIIDQHTILPMNKAIMFQEKAAIQAGSDTGSSAVEVTEESCPYFVTESEEVETVASTNNHQEPNISQVESEAENSQGTETNPEDSKLAALQKPQTVVKALGAASSVSSSVPQSTPPPGFEAPSLSLSRKSSCSLIDKPPGFEANPNFLPGFSASDKIATAFTTENRGQIPDPTATTKETSQNHELQSKQKTSDFYDPEFEADFSELPHRKQANLEHQEHLLCSAPALYKVDENGLIINYMEAFHTRQLYVHQILKRNDTGPLEKLASWNKVENIGQIVANLKRLHQLYPQGCTALQLHKFDENLRLSNNSESEDEESSNYNYMSMAFLIDNQMLQVSQSLFWVNPIVLSTTFIQLKKNFCSNFYRLLYQSTGQAKVKDILPQLKKLVPHGCKVGIEDILCVCNRYPLLFTLKASQKDNYSLTSSVISLNASLPDWKILLDSDNTVIEGTLCDCLMCAR